MDTGAKATNQTNSQTVFVSEEVYVWIRVDYVSHKCMANCSRRWRTFLTFMWIPHRPWLPIFTNFGGATDILLIRRLQIAQLAIPREFFLNTDQSVNLSTWLNDLNSRVICEFVFWIQTKDILFDRPGPMKLWSNGYGLWNWKMKEALLTNGWYWLCIALCFRWSNPDSFVY